MSSNKKKGVPAFVNRLQKKGPDSRSRSASPTGRLNGVAIGTSPPTFVKVPVRTSPSGSPIRSPASSAKASQPQSVATPPLVPLPAVALGPAPAPAPAPAPVPHALDEFKLTTGELTRFDYFRKEGTPNILKTIIEPKFARFRTAVRPNYVVDVTKYDDVYITSDIHSDFRKLVQILSKADLIVLPTKINASKELTNLDPYNDDIYDSRLITETKWNATRTLFVIAGDLVDGRRNVDVSDRYGTFEISLHCFLYNLRIEALKTGSEVLFTIGNHDLTSVLKANEAFATKYGASALWTDFYGRLSNITEKVNARKLLLKPFYMNCPYYFLSLENGPNKEVGIIHASLHKQGAPKKVSILQNVIDEQNAIINGTRNLEDFFSTEGDLTEPEPLWQRVYAENGSPSRCEPIQELNYNLIVVGHCTTPSAKDSTGADIYSRFVSLYREKSLKSLAQAKESTQCQAIDGIGCILLDCYDAVSKNPKLAFVDTAISSAFRSSADDDINRKRIVDILHLTRSGTPSQYYTVGVERLNPTQSPPTEKASSRPMGRVSTPSHISRKGGRKPKRPKTRKIKN
jgi:hypothetical protein